MKTLSKEQVLRLHNALLETFGGTAGIRDDGLLESALNAPFATFGGQYLYPSVQAKAAQLGFGLVCNHPSPCPAASGKPPPAPPTIQRAAAAARPTKGSFFPAWWTTFPRRDGAGVLYARHPMPDVFSTTSAKLRKSPAAYH